MTFLLHPNLANKHFILDFPLCKVFLEDESHYPWLILVPKIPNASKLMDLSLAEQQQLLIELDFTQKILWEEFKPTQLNVAALGNKTPQLHIHVIARNSQDVAWPGVVWDHPDKKPYSEELKKTLTQKLRFLLEGFSPRSTK